MAVALLRCAGVRQYCTELCGGATHQCGAKAAQTETASAAAAAPRVDGKSSVQSEASAPAFHAKTRAKQNKTKKSATATKLARFSCARSAPTCAVPVSPALAGIVELFLLLLMCSASSFIRADRSNVHRRMEKASRLRLLKPAYW